MRLLDCTKYLGAVLIPRHYSPCVTTTLAATSNARAILSPDRSKDRRLRWCHSPYADILKGGFFRLYSHIRQRETWKSTAKIRQQLDVFHQRNLRKILGITWKDHVTNLEVLNRTGQRRLGLQDIVAERRLLMAGHIIRMPPGGPANHAMSWTLVVVADDEVVQQ